MSAILNWTNKARRVYNATIGTKHSTNRKRVQPMKQETQHYKGEDVQFIGFTGNELPDNSELVVEGEIYTIIEVTPQDDQNEEFYTVGVANPEYDPDKRKTKNNRPEIGVELYADEFDTEFDVSEEPEEEAEVVEEVVEEVKEVKPKTKPKTKAKAKPKTKAKTKPKTKAKVAEAPKAELVKPKSKLKEVSEDKDKETDLVILDESEEDEEVLELVKGTDDICALAEEMRKDASNQDYMLGGILYHVYTSKAYKELDERYAGNKGFALYVDECLGIRYRTAMNQISVYTMFSKFNIDKAEYIRLGPTKCTEIARVASEDNVEDLVELAGDSTVMEIKDSIKESYVAGGDGALKKVKRVAFKFMLHEDQGATVRSLFEDAKQALGVESDEDAFESIVTEWAMDHLNVKGAAKTKAKARASAKSKAKAKDEVEATA